MEGEVFLGSLILLCSLPGSQRSFPGAPELPGVRLDPARVPVYKTRLPAGRGHPNSAPALPEKVLLQHGPRRPARHRGLLLHPAVMQRCRQGEREENPSNNSSLSRAAMELSLGQHSPSGAGRDKSSVDIVIYLMDSFDVVNL